MSYVKALIHASLLFCALVSPAAGIAQAPESFCGKTTAVFFGNGVNTTFAAAVASSMELTRKLNGRMPEEEFRALSFFVAYNRTDGLLRDLLESTIQSLANDYSRFWRLLAGLDLLPDNFQDAALRIAEEADKATLVNIPDLQRHVSFYKAKILEGHKVVVVSHSQGNFFANEAYAHMSASERLSFGIVSAANPDTFVAGGGPYTTLVGDLVILAIAAAKSRAHLPLPLPPNTTNGFGLGSDILGHSFVDAYLVTLSTSEDQILDDVVTTIAHLDTPSGRGTAGIITVTLTWGAQPDVDLHAFEPNGAHVYYGSRVGPSGFLDVDDVSGFGPEHYTVACDTLEAGTYRIGVNYFRGFAPEVATVQIQAGSTVRTFTRALPAARGGAGDASPVAVANVLVEEDAATGAFRFSIVEQ